MYFSFIIPVYNRPQEINELLQSISNLDYKGQFEVVVIEDGSTERSENIISNYSQKLNIAYYYKENTGPGDSRNYGMQKAKGNYFIILDSDCILPPHYLSEVENSLKHNYVDCFGGPDNALPTFSKVQRAINFSMTSFLTTGGIRGASERIDKFQPRSFNMGISKQAFFKSKGFGNIHPGEDPELTIRLWKLGFQTKLISTAFVYHKRRIDWHKFYTQVNKFGKVRPILNKWHPNTAKLTYWFPIIFCIGLALAFLLLIFKIPYLIAFFALYFLVIGLVATIQNNSFLIGFYAVVATIIQFYGYGIGFVESYIKISICNRKPQEVFPNLFFKKMPKIIGLTGGIGSGKSTVARYFQDKGVPVYIADVEAKKLMETQEVIEEVVVLLGESVLTKEGELDRKAIASIVFNNKELLEGLNKIIHPKVKQHFKEWLQNYKEEPFIIKEVAILFETKGNLECDKVILVSAPEEVRIARTIARDQVSKEAVLERIKNQMPENEKEKMADYIIRNEELEETYKQVDDLLKLLKNS